MIHRGTKLAIALGMAMMVAGCHHNKVANPIGNLDSKQPDKVLFDRAMDAMKHGKYDVARITLQTLINTYPDSEYIARAKLAVGDSWYAEGSTAAYQQAEVEYKDFITFFPNLPEAAEAQLKIANMHYKQMEKADRDYTHAMRAEDEYRQLLQQFPDTDKKLLEQAKQHLRDVQEVLAERQYRIGRFYFLKESYPAAIARLKSLVDTYPLYSQSDEALMMLGRAYESEVTLIKNSKLLEARKILLVSEYQTDAAQAYSRVIERYPLSDHAGDAQSRLKDLGRPIPKPTEAAIAQNKAEEQSRSELSRFKTFTATFHKSPDDLVRASKVGEPILVDPEQTSAPKIIRSATNTALGISDTGNGTVNVEKVTGDPSKSDPVPRSDAPPPGPAPATNAAPAAAAPASSGTGSDTGIGELTPNIAPAATTSPATTPTPADNASAPAAGATGTADTPPQAPAQVNEIQNGSSTAANASATNSAATSTSDEGSSSSKKKKKKGLRKIF